MSTRAAYQRKERRMTNETATQLEAIGSLPKVDLDLLDVDGNAFAITGAVLRAARRAGWTAEQIDQWTDVALSDDYDHLLRSALAVVA